MCGASLIVSVPASAVVNLELRPAFQTVEVGQPVQVGLYAVSPTSQSFASVDVVLLWTQALIDLTGNSNVGAVPLLVSSFPAGDPYGLNLNLHDGDAFYVAFAMLGNPVVATPSGTLLTTFQFTATATGSAMIEMPLTHPSGARTRVLDGTVPNLNVTGTVTGAVIDVIADTCPADLNNDNMVDVTDLFMLLAAWGTCPGGCPADLSGDEIINVTDLFMLLAAWGPCP